ncbi:sensor histidine kinase [Streptomyces sp. NBC_01201]|uniref:Sensor histidine kinase n=1 Tax=Streptomyces glycanivorans TaxID=3033808 RepID=A0ABY9JAT3_9ACTN|nr:MULTISPECIES: sensor histidine kinase [unclassified Streptomyces]WSQ77462.1 sensor histidine kinase [Streptomyces sp. NBC_01213]TXS18158.1 sensor histidine kinase [Streptomyces sp. wa22]WLQ64069.1 sensor histidine kinase [Streptomyces sp. Alt3]WSQ84819.1 sensor histidine kinase [Streptomyces sp. NBC_01212]WSR48178.1 sensor histidine kinase [Streptomyces sp. NBC_01201]
MSSGMTVEQRWAQFYRYGPYTLLGIAVLMAALSSGLIGMSGAEMYATGGLVTVAWALQLWWGRTEAGVPAKSSAAGAYYVLRTLIAFALCWFNPFFSIYAVVGYFDVGHLLPKRFVRAGLLCTAVIMAGSQSGSGMPPASPVNWAAFGALFVLHAFLTLLFGNLSAREEERTRRQTATISELELANTRLEQALAENATLHAQLLLQAREAGIADERRRLAAEIHDTIAQGLTGVIAQLQAVTSTADPAVAREHLDRAAGLARHSLGEARRSVRNLVPAALEHDDLPGALARTVTGWAERTGVRADFTVTGTVEPLHDEVGATLLRIAEESLSNAARHAGASRAGVTLSYMGDEITLDVRDDGCGFDPAGVPPYTGRGGFGLGGMRARAERIAGTVTVETAPGLGTAVSARVPLVRLG